jgi:branched-chain amino acid transport system permease protein
MVDVARSSRRRDRDGLIAFVLGSVILRTRGHRFIIITVVFAELMKLVATNWIDMDARLHGPAGPADPALYVPGIGAIDLAAKGAVLLRRPPPRRSWRSSYGRSIVRSSIGRKFILIRENEPLASRSASRPSATR